MNENELWEVFDELKDKLWSSELTTEIYNVVLQEVGDDESWDEDTIDKILDKYILELTWVSNDDIPNN